MLNWLLAALADDAFVLLIGMYVILGLCELLIPARPVPRSHYLRGSAYGVLHTLTLIAVAPAVAYFTTFLTRHLGLGLIDLRAWRVGGPIGAAVFALFLSTLIADFFLYWYHRVRHSSSVLWQTHVVHHSDEHLNVTTYARGHLTEVVLAPILVTLPIALLFQLPPVTVAVLSLVPRIWEYFTHANLRLGFGPFWWLLVSPDYHRIHHSIELRHRDRNFATWFPIMDIAFGTAWRPRPGERPATGVDGVREATIWQLYAMPFQGWAKMLRGTRPAVAGARPSGPSAADGNAAGGKRRSAARRAGKRVPTPAQS